ncbi:MAG: TonB-dependent receptor plug domain-containing protein [Ignavibacteria bacterium]|nr:TonB-dependent receptor plug domain-containing protein [Ignavibacteria bacterium]
MYIIQPAKKYYYFIYLLLSFIFINSASYSQTDSLRRKTDSLSRIPFDTLKIKNTVQFSQQSDTISYNDFIWDDKRNVSEVLEEKSGFFVNNKGLGQYNRINYNEFKDFQIGFFKDGIQINNNFFGIFDPELISINEIEKIEVVSNISSFIYGINSYGKAINIITKDKFQTKPFSQLRYSQDRSGSLFADASFSIPLSKKFNFLIRANNHSGDGLYSNSSFSAWRANGRMSWFPSAKWNFKLDFAYAKISRGLNEGLNFYGKDLSRESAVDSLRDVKASVLDNRGNEVSTTYNPSLTIYSQAFGSNSLTMMQIYYTNYYRNYGGKYYPLDTTQSYINDFYNTTALGVNLKYNKKILLSNSQKIDLTILNNYCFNTYDPDYELTSDLRITKNDKANFGFVSGKLDYANSRFFISGLFKAEQSFVKDSSQTELSVGGEAKLKLIANNSYQLNVIGGANHIHGLNFYPVNPLYANFGLTNYEAGAEFISANFKTLAAYYNSTNAPGIKFNFEASYGAFNLKSESNFNLKDYENSIPLFSKNDFSYRNKFFKDKLDLKLGVNFKFIMNYKYFAQDYIMLTDDRFYSGMDDSRLDFSDFNNKFLADFYIGARIGHANINFTVANIFNSFYFDTYMFPSDDRGGLGNAVSRFTIVWDFIN